MDSAKATSAQRKQVKDACLHVLSTFEDSIMTTNEVTDLIISEFPHLEQVIKTHRGNLVGQVLFQIAQNKGGAYRHIQNPSRGRYIFSRTALPERVRYGTKVVREWGRPLPVAEPVKEPEQAPEAVDVKEVAERHTINPFIEGAPNFTFVGKIGGRYIVRNDKGTLYVLQPAELA